MLQDVDRSGIATRLETKVLEITPDTVRIERAGKREELAADTVVLAVGTKAYNPLQKTAAELGIHCLVVGDAERPATAFEATHSGYRARGRGIA